MNHNKSIERNLKLHYALYSTKLREIIGPTEGYLELEKKLGRRKVDIFFSQDTGKEIYIELQIYEADRSHLKQVLSIIESSEIHDESLVIWIATSFSEEMLRSVRIALSKSPIKLEFMALTVGVEMISILEDFSNIDDFEIVEKIKYMDEYDSIKLQAMYSNEGTLEVRKYSFKRLANSEDELIRWYLTKIRKEMPYWITAWNGKQLSGRMISFSCIFDVAFRFGLDRYNNLTVTVSFAYSQFRLYRDLFICGHIIDEKLEKTPTWDTKNHKLYYSIPYNEEDKESILEKQVKVLKDYVDVFSKLAEYRNEIISAPELELEPLVANILDMKMHRPSGVSVDDMIADMK